MGAKVLNSDNEDVKSVYYQVETSISAGYKELQNEKKKNKYLIIKIENIILNHQPHPLLLFNLLNRLKNQVSEEVKAKCEDLKTESQKNILILFGITRLT